MSRCDTCENFNESEKDCNAKFILPKAYKLSWNRYFYMKNSQDCHYYKCEAIKIYLCGSYQDRIYILSVAEILEQRGYKVVSRWLKEHKDTDEENAKMDLEDIDSCDIFIHIKPADMSGNINEDRLFHTGGRHFESGYAYAKGKKIIRTLNTENVFDSLYNGHIDHYVSNTVDAIIEAIKQC